MRRLFSCSCSWPRQRRPKIQNHRMSFDFGQRTAFQFDREPGKKKEDKSMFLAFFLFPYRAFWCVECVFLMKKFHSSWFSDMGLYHIPPSSWIGDIIGGRTHTDIGRHTAKWNQFISWKWFDRTVRQIHFGLALLLFLPLSLAAFLVLRCDRSLAMQSTECVCVHVCHTLRADW